MREKSGKVQIQTWPLVHGPWINEWISNDLLPRVNLSYRGKPYEGCIYRYVYMVSYRGKPYEGRIYRYVYMVSYRGKPCEGCIYRYVYMG